LLPVGLVVFVSFRTNEEGYPFETSTNDKCFFSSEIADGRLFEMTLFFGQEPKVHHYQYDLYVFVKTCAVSINIITLV